MMNLLNMYVGSLRSALQGDLTGAQALYEQAEALKSEQGLSFSESVHPDLPYLEQALTTLLSSYDFTRCVRPDGSAYGTRGKCRKGSEEAKGFEPGKFPRKGKEDLKNKIIDMKYEIAAAKRKVSESYTSSTRKKAKAELAALERRREKLLKEYKGWEY